MCAAAALVRALAAKNSDEYVVGNAVPKQWERGIALYEVKREGYEDTTWEPVTNLVIATELVRAYEEERKRSSQEAKAARKAIADKRKADAQHVHNTRKF